MGKYITNPDGTLTLNPEYKKTSDANTLRSNALTVVSSPDDLMDAGVRIPRPLRNVIDLVQNPEYASGFQIPNMDVDLGDQLLDGLGNFFSENGIPIGLIGMAAALRHYALHFLIDDSGSMTRMADLSAENVSQYMRGIVRSGGQVTRWQDAQDRLHQMVDLLKYVPTLGITISFLNRTDKSFYLSQAGKTPDQFAAEAHRTISNVFNSFLPNHATPLYSRLSEIMERPLDTNTPTAFYILTDGEPCEGSYTREQLISNIQDLLLKGRRSESAQQFPVTFIDCTDEPQYTEWTRELEEESEAGQYMLYIAAVEDFTDEQTQVLLSQGPKFPYTRGIWLLASLAGALDPNGLDALDQPEPLTKCIIDFLLGRVLAEAEYRAYFDTHPYANRFFKEDYELFLTVNSEGFIPSVIEFRRTLSQALSKDIKKGDDNSERREIETTGSIISKMREQGIFQAANQGLTNQIAQLRVAWSRQSPNLAFSMVDTISYPGKPQAGFIPQNTSMLVTGMPPVMASVVARPAQNQQPLVSNAPPLYANYSNRNNAVMFSSGQLQQPTTTQDSQSSNRMTYA